MIVTRKICALTVNRNPIVKLLAVTSLSEMSVDSQDR
jgi:hypothetical protein